MSVTPSPIGGFAAQFFDNNGVILSGGKIYTYAAGTTTPQATYTSASGVTPHSNPIILDSAGRVPGGEIWLTDGLVYKFVIETATGILLGTYDNITGVNSNFVNYTVQEEVITATAGQTVFNLSTINYTPGTNSLSVYIDGVNQYVGDSYLETDSNTVTFTAGVHVGGEVKFTTAIQTTTGAVDASIVSYEPPYTGSVATNVEAKLAQIVSVKDFGAVGDGVANDAPAIQAAIDAMAALGGGTVYAPSGTYLLASFTSAPYYTVKAKSNVSVFGDGPDTIFKLANGMVTSVQGVAFLYSHDVALTNIRYSNFKVDWNGPNNLNQNTVASNVCRLGGGAGITNWHIDNVWFLNPGGHHNIVIAGGGNNNSVTNCLFQNAGRAVTGNTLITDHSSIYTDCNQLIVSNNVFTCDNLNDTVATAIELHGNQIICEGNSVYGYSIGVIAGASENTGNNFHYNISDNVLTNVIDGIRLVTADANINDFYIINANEVYCRPLTGRNSIGIGTLNSSSVMSGQIKISNNLIMLNACPELARVHTGISLTDWSNVNASGNNIVNWSAAGFYYENTVGVGNFVDVSSNFITGCGYTSDAVSKRSIAVNAGAGGTINSISISGNTVSTATPYGGTVAVNGLTFNSNSYNRIEILDNTVSGQSGSSIVKGLAEPTKVCFVRQASTENPITAAIKATFGSQWSSTAEARQWYAVEAANNGNSNVWQSVEYGLVAPVSGEHYRGDRCINSEPAVGQPKGWICTVNGTPGTWVSEGNL
jgi:hypothetical protein